MKFTIIRTSTVRSGRLDRAGKDDLWVVYTVEGGAASSVTLPAEDADDAKIIAAVEANEARHGELRGKTLGQ